MAGILQLGARYILCEHATSEWPRRALQSEVLGAWERDLGSLVSYLTVSHNVGMRRQN